MSVILVLLTSFLLAAGGAVASAGQDPPAEQNPATDAASDTQPSTEQANPPSPEAAEARQEFDAALTRYQQLQEEIAALEEQRDDVRGGELDQLNQDLLAKRNEADGVIGELAAAGAAVYAADPDAYPEVNATVREIARFYLTGDRRGDGGDQYEKALTVIEAMLEAGAGDQWNDLYLWGATAAYCTNHFEQAQEYFAKAEQAGLLEDSPPVRNRRDPRYRLWEQAKQYQSSVDELQKAWEREKQLREKDAEADDLPRVAFHTSKGTVVFELFENEAPEATASFLSLVKKGFYDGVSFHRVLPGFMAQGGDPTGTGSGGPGYNIRCECYEADARDHFRGSLSMAHAGRDTGGSQFFITFVPTSFLDGRHTVFGRVVEGMENAAALKRRDPQSANPGKPDTILRAEVLRDRGHEYKFEKLPDN